MVTSVTLQVHQVLCHLSYVKNEVQSVQRLHSTNSDQRLDLARWHGVHTVLPAAHTFIHEWNEPSCIHFVSLHQMASPKQGGTHLDQLTTGTQFIDPDMMKGWVGLVGWPIVDVLPTSGHPSATGRAWDRESSPVKDRRSTIVQRSQRTHYIGVQLDSPWAISGQTVYIHSTVVFSEKSCFEHKNA